MNSKNNKLYYEEKYFIANIHNRRRLDIKCYWRLIKYPFYNILYKFLLLFLPKPRYNKKYKLALCSIFKNEAIFFKEWIEYHLELGVEHFYLYNNNSEDEFMEVLKEYIDTNIVTLTEWPEIPGQISAYKHWYNNFRSDSQWVSFLDLDEYICPKYDSNLIDWLVKYEKYPVIVMYWLMFGTSGKLKHDITIPLIEQYTHCWNKIGKIGKVLYNTDYEISEFENEMHHLLYVKWNKIEIPPFNDSGNVIKWNDIHFINNNNGFSIQLNHYWSRAFNIMEDKLSRGDSAYSEQWRTLDIFFQKEFNNKSVNYEIHRFLLRLKLRLNKK